VKKFYYSILILLILLNVSCSKNIKKKSVISEKDLNSQVLESYKEGMKALNEKDVLFAAKKFNEVEILFPQSEWAPKSSIMAAYSYYSQDYYDDAINELLRFLKVYPKYKDIDYVYYLLAISYYEQIVDEKKDLQSLVNAKKNFEIIINNFSKSEYSIDASFKIDLINDILAAKEIYVGRYYFDQKKWIAAINRFKVVITEYETTIYTEEALHRLVEVYYILGLIEEAEKYAKLLGYNYQSSEWYEKSYSVFNKMYEVNKKNNFKKDKDKNNSILRKFKSLFNFDE
jgi:outer membrane protein assembly factor BamD